MAVAERNSTSLASGLELTKANIPDQDRAKALAVLDNTPLPTTRTEAWKYTRVAKLNNINFSNAASTLDSVSEYLIDDTNATFVFVNGRFDEELSSNDIPAGVSCSLISELDAVPTSMLDLEDEVFHALNTAYLNDGVLVTIEANANVERPIQIIHISQGENNLSNLKTIVRSGKSSKATIIQGFFSDKEETSFCNNSTEITVGENAHLTLEKVQYEAASAYHISTEQVSQAKNSTFSINTLTLNGGLVRNNLNINVDGENCTTNLNGAYLLKGKQHVDNHTVVDHRVPNCESHELYKGVLDEKSTGVFNGKVFVRQDAQKISAFQSNGNVLLSDDATINSKPELEIYADDVKCSHGSTTGQLDEDAVFYLRARGISEKAARQLMVSAFVGEVLEKIETPSVLSFTEQLLQQRFGWDF